MKDPSENPHIREGADLVPKGSKIRTRLFVGGGSRINGPLVVKGGAPCRIGKHCALGDGVRIITSDHGTGLLNLSAMLQREITGSTGHVSKGGVAIGNNVWIGDGVVILSGVKIGNGAIIGAGAIVTKDVPRYSVAVGNPAKVIKTRFGEDLMDLFDELKWWDWSLDRMRANAFLFAPEALALKPDEIRKQLRLPGSS
jgi:virginiamycin A acetyltransferase